MSAGRGPRRRGRWRRRARAAAAGAVGGDAQRLGVLAAAEQDQGDVGAERGGVGRRHAAGARHQGERGVGVAGQRPFPHRPVERRVAGHGGGARRVALFRGEGKVGRQRLGLGGRGRRNGAARQEAREQGVEAGRVRVVAVAGQPGLEFRGGGLGAGLEPAVRQHLAEQALVFQPLRFARRGGEVARRLVVEDAPEAAGLGRGQHGRQPVGRAAGGARHRGARQAQRGLLHRGGDAGRRGFRWAVAAGGLGVFDSVLGPLRRREDTDPAHDTAPNTIPPRRRGRLGRRAMGAIALMARVRYCPSPLQSNAEVEDAPQVS
jgi:hypothetical protein